MIQGDLQTGPSSQRFSPYELVELVQLDDIHSGVAQNRGKEETIRPGIDVYFAAKGAGRIDICQVIGHHALALVGRYIANRRDPFQRLGVSLSDQHPGIKKEVYGFHYSSVFG